MNSPNLYDAIFVAAVLAGMWTSRKGLPVELLPVARWLTVVLVGAVVYKPIALFFVGLTNISFTTAAVWTYIVVTFGVVMAFVGLKTAIQRTLESSTFLGKADQPLGMVAGGVKALFVIVAVMAVLNTQKSSAAQLAANARMQQDSFGDISFPTPSRLQHDMVAESWFGGLVSSRASFLLIDPAAAPEETESIIERRDPLGQL